MTGDLSVHKRTVYTRSRSGCLVCRKRRIKCDEAKPTCKCCQMAGWTCEYGPSDQNGRPRFRPKAKSTFGRRQQYRLLLTGPDNADGTVTLADRKAISYFSRVAAGPIFNYLTSDFWTRLVPQRGHLSPVIRSAMVAFSSIHQNFTRACYETSPSEAVVIKETVKSDQLYAVAVVHLRTYIANTATPSKLEVLLTSALFICFTLLRRRPKEATRHLDQAASILRSWKQDMEVVDSTRSTSTERDDYQTIADAFCALDVHASAYNDTRSPHLNAFNHEDGNEIILDPPYHFVSLRHAQQTLIRLISMAGENLFQCIPYKIDPSRTVPKELVSRRQSLRVSFRDWLTSLSHSASQHQVSFFGTSIEHRKARTAYAAMRTQHLAMTTLLNETLQETDEISAFLFDEQAHQILYWAELATHDYNISRSEKKTAKASAHRTFSVDMGIGPVLFMLAIKTSQAVIRSKALSLLSSIHRLEGWFDPSAVVSSIGYISVLQGREGSTQAATLQLNASNGVERPINLETTAYKVATEVFEDDVSIGRLQDLATLRLAD